jgi:hypothetical protein
MTGKKRKTTTRNSATTPALAGIDITGEVNGGTVDASANNTATIYSAAATDTTSEVNTRLSMRLPLTPLQQTLTLFMDATMPTPSTAALPPTPPGESTRRPSTPL